LLWTLLPTHVPMPDAFRTGDMCILPKSRATIGHRYSLLAYLPEKDPQAPAWSPFVSVRRVGTGQDPEALGCQQVRKLLEVHPAPAGDILTLGDSRYSKPCFVYPLVREKTNILVRLRCNRVVYTAPASSQGRGHPRWYGKRFALHEPATWPEPDKEAVWSGTTKNGKELVFHAQAWYDIRMRGSRSYPMHGCPFTLVRIEVRTPKGELVYSRPLWLALFGPLRRRLSLEEVYKAYLQRFDQEHGQRLVKQKLLATAYHTPDVEHEQRWWNSGFGLFSALACKGPCWCGASSLGEVSSPMAKWQVFAFVPWIDTAGLWPNNLADWHPSTQAQTQGKTPWEGPGGSFATPETASRGQKGPLTARL